MPDPDSIIEPIRRTQRRQSWAIFAIFVTLVLLGGYIAKSANDTVDALCSLRVGLESEVAGSEDFLLKHPQGIPGITPATIRLGIERQEHTIKALGSLSCGGSIIPQLL